MGISAGLLVGAAPSQADVQAFYQGLSPEAQNAFNELDASQQMQTVELAQVCGSFGGTSSCGASSCNTRSSCGASSCNTRSSCGGSSSYMGGSSSCGASSCSSSSSRSSARKNRRTGGVQYFFFGKSKPPRGGSSSCNSPSGCEGKSKQSSSGSSSMRNYNDMMGDSDYNGDMMGESDYNGSNSDTHADTPLGLPSK